MRKNTFTILLLCGILMFAGLSFGAHEAQAETRHMVFPVLGPVWYSNDFGAPRSGGRTHEGTDIFGEKHQPLLAAVSGTIKYVASPEPSWGYSVTLTAPDGWTYHYLHINNDNIGTDDGNGGETNAYAPDVRKGYPVTAGQIIAYMGDSGNAEATPDHLHFEIRNPEGTAINAFDSLNAAPRFDEPVKDYTPLDDELLPFGRFQGGASIALGEFSSKHEGNEVVMAAKAGGGPHVRVMSQDGVRVSDFFAFENNMRDGLDVAVGDLDGDDINEIIVGTGPGAIPMVRVFTLQGEMLQEFPPLEPYHRVGVNVAAADVDGDGNDDIMVAPGRGYSPWLKIYNGEGVYQTEFLTYGLGFKGGFDVSAYSATETEDASIVTSAGRGGGPHIRVFDGEGNRTSQFFAYSERFRGGVRIEVADLYPSIDGPEIVTVPENSGGPDFRIYSLRGKKLKSLWEYEEWWRGGFDVGAFDGDIFVSSKGNRRTSVRQIF